MSKNDLESYFRETKPHVIDGEYLLRATVSAGRVVMTLFPDNGEDRQKEFVVKGSTATAMEEEAAPEKQGGDHKASFDFGTALRLIKAGSKVRRAGWNGKGMFIFYVPANKYHASGNKNGTLAGQFPDDMVPYQGYTAIKTAENTVVPWTVSQSDQHAEDWEIVQ